ncbi:unnamed protein product [Linum trigynum]|uniref:Nuclear pore complex protein NUP214 n=1 Tax=Linum trigynum TaxID=586398 RepID=A0AAV2DGZ1_9ROSI
MASAPEAPSDVRRIELEEEAVGPRFVNNDYFFHRIGKPIPILQQSSPHPFDLQNPPSRPLAVSSSHLFLAHSSGFCVARTKDVIDEAARLTGNSDSAPCVQQLSIVDLPIADVHILSLSFDSSTLAVAVAGNLHFFPVISLLKNDVKPSFSCSLTGPSTIKDIQWRTNSQNSCLVLSSDCKLHHAAPDVPLKHVMDSVDAVAWSVKGESIAIARENRLVFLSTKFKERLSISLPFNSWGGIVKVDCIRWVRVDSIVIGCYQHSEDGMEEDYRLQVIRSKDGKITDAASKLGVLSFYDLFSGLIDDIVPNGSGPYLFLSYLEHSEVAIVANRKNTDQHIMLLGWSVGVGKNETAVLDIDRDTWLPRIQLQDNGDDNLIMGLCVDNVSFHGKVKVEVGLDEQKEVLPLCVLICATLEGKLVMFHVASRIGNTIPPEADSAVHDEEGAFPFEVPDAQYEDNLSLLGEHKPKPHALGIPVQNSSQPGAGISKDSGVPFKCDLKPSDKEQGSTKIVAENMRSVDTPDRNHIAKHIFNHESLSYEQPRDSVPVPQQGINGQQLLPFGLPSMKFDQSSSRTTVSEGLGILNGQAERSQAQKLSLGETPLPSSSAKASGNIPSQLQLRGNLFPEKSESTASLSHPANKGSVARISASNSFRDHPGKPVHLSDGSAQLNSVDPARPTQMGRLGVSSGVGKLESLPCIRTQLSYQDGLNQRPHVRKEKSQSLSNAMPNMTRQFGSIQEMVKELDMLLEGIQKKGGFRDACTVSLKSSIEAMETGFEAFSRNCAILKGMMDKQLEEIQHLLDNTTQVLARKAYMDGIVKQTSDSKYWELWDRQKLSPELELKRQHIWELNQDLMTKLVELERHFNTLELQQFGESASHGGQSAFHNKYGPSRQMQSVHSLCNSTNSQIAAAEHLSDCLSKQLEVLQIQSPVKRKNIKRELFETIGIPYDVSFSSPDADKADHKSSSVKHILYGSVTSKHQSRRCQSGALKGIDSESARRRRDSLDQSWTSFEPTKTTVKRVLLQDNHESMVRKSSMLMDSRDFGRHSLDGPDLLLLEDDISANFLKSYGNKGTEYPSTSQGTGSGSPMQRGNSTASLSVGSIISSIVGQNGAKQTAGTPSANDSSSRGSGFEKYANLHKKSAPATLPSSGMFSFQKPFECPNNQGNASFTSSAVVNMKPGPESESRLPFDSVALAAPNTPGRSPQPIKNLFDDKGPSLGFIKQLSDSSSQTTSLPNIPSMSSPMSLSTTATSFPKVVGPLMSSSCASTDARNSRLDPASFAAPNLFSNSNIQPGEGVQPLGSSIRFPVSSPQTVMQLNVPSLPSAMSSVLPMTSAAMSHGTSISSSMANYDGTLLGYSTSCPAYSPTPVSSAGNLPLITTKKLSSLGETVSSLDVASPTSVPPQIEVQPTQSKTLSCATQILAARGESTSDEGADSTLQLDTTKVQHIMDRSLPYRFDSTCPTLDSSTAEIQRPANETSAKSDVIAEADLQNVLSLGLKSELYMVPTPTAETAVSSASSNHSAFNEVSATSSSSAPVGAELQLVSQAQCLFEAPALPENNINSFRFAKNEGSDLAVSEEDEMEEEAPVISPTNELSSLGTLGGFGIGSTPGSVAPSVNPFGGAFGTHAAASSSFTMTVPTGELFRPASFSFQSPLPSQPHQSANNVAGGFSSGFGTAGTGEQSPTQSTFGQPAQVGAGQQALGTVLGSFGQSRQLGGPVLPGGGFGVGAGGSAFGGFASNSSPPAGGGFSGAATGGGFANLAKSGGSGFGGLGSAGVGMPSGFGGLASAGGSTPSGFGGLASAGGGGFGASAGGGGGFGGAAASGGGGGGFGAFGSQQGGGGFGAFVGQQGSAFSGFGGVAGGGGTGKLPEAFTVMRK